MRHEKIVDCMGGKAKINVLAVILFHLEEIRYRIGVEFKGKGQRKWRQTINGDDWDYIKLSLPERRLFEEQKFEELVGKENIHQAKLELWEKLKP